MHIVPMARAGAWDIAYDDESHQCFANTLYSDQSFFLVGRTAPGAIFVIAVSPRWRFTEGQQYELTVELAGQSSASVKKGSLARS